MTDIVTGLTTEEVNKLKEQGLDNIPVGNQSKTIGQIIAGNVFTYFNFVFAVFAALLILVRSYINMTFLPIILLNTILGIVQEIKAKIVLDRLTVVNAPRTKVIRDSAVSEVDSVTLVKGDVCIFTAGNQLSADAILAEGCVRVNEAMVTGESDEVIKNKGDILLSGSYIVSGECKAVLTQVGHKAYAARLGADYVGMGAVFHTSTKKDAKDLSRDNLLKLTAMLDMPIVAIGGINYDNCDYLKDTGVDGIAVVSAIFASDDCAEATRKLYKKTRKLFNYNKNIIFDMDGTLVDSMPFWKNSAREYAILRGAKLPKNFDEITGVMDLSEYAVYLQNVLGIDTSLEQITEAAVDIMNKHYASDIPAKKGMIKLIRREYEAGSKLVIFSASDTSSVEILLKRLEIYECFEGIYTVYDVGIGKSDKESYKKVARSAGMDISDTWVYEDILRGVRAAHNAGLKVCAVYDKDSADDWDEICSIADKCIITG